MIGAELAEGRAVKQVVVEPMRKLLGIVDAAFVGPRTTLIGVTVVSSDCSSEAFVEIRQRRASLQPELSRRDRAARHSG
jgi:hypothetical protein